MPFYMLICILILICFTTGLINKAVLDVKPFELAFACICILALARFTISPLPELELNAAVVALPIFLAVLANISSHFAAAAYFSLAPLMALVLGCAVEFALMGYTSFSADSNILDMQVVAALCALVSYKLLLMPEY